ncbi:FtsQ-type POTRA domain-containing protein [Paenarthrobacter sp. DKR-5]|uniref:cell division protein FtsQ/DivIB n=1 Tax=Paenarthrobacter sp. DKR-5 TaxID=2835535 RepID=UPI001BDD91FC|nr:FtsQ-type POTRA domain-containing protein [Paenarthrobacter sp. DKR-5]MBT1002148.1 FtsQ-type POTRA domain-containing protein [Paenarthrobacter sp. DKR-5]
MSLPSVPTSLQRSGAAMPGNRKPPVISSRGNGAATAGPPPAPEQGAAPEQGTADGTGLRRPGRVFSATKDVDPAPAQENAAKNSAKSSAKNARAARQADGGPAGEDAQSDAVTTPERSGFRWPGRRKAVPGADPDDAANVLAFPEPPARRRRRRLLLTAGAVVAVVAALVAVLVFSPLLAVRTIKVDGLKLATAKQVDAALAPLKGKPLPQVDAAQVQQLLGRLPQVHYSTIEARPPSTLLVHITERVPVALVKNGNAFVQVDQDGVQVATVKDRSAVALPVIDGGTAAVGKNIFKAITAVLAVLPPAILARMDHAQASSVDSVQLTLNDGKTVVWGNASEKELKAKVLQALLNAAPSTLPGAAPVQVYDVSTPRDPVTR